MTIENGNELLAKQGGKYAAMFVCFLLGNGTLFEWNSILTIGDYYLAVFPKYHPSRVLTLVYQPFAVGTLLLLTYQKTWMSIRVRVLSGFIIFFISTLALLIMNVATSGMGGIGPFMGVCIVSACFGIAEAHVQGGLVGDLSSMCPEFVQSFFAGLAVSGALTSGLRLMTKAAFDNSNDGLQKGATLFFAISTFFVLLCIVLYEFVFPNLPIVKYYQAKLASETSATNSSDTTTDTIKNENSQEAKENLDNKALVRENIDYFLSTFLIYVLTLSIIPGFLSEDTGSHSLGSWYALVLIAMYNCWDLIGRYIPLVEFVKLKSRRGLTVATISRFLFIPAFYFTAKYGDQGYMIMLTSLLGLTNGYLTVCIFTAAPQGYKGPEQFKLGNLLVLFLLGGIFSGVTLDWLWLISKGW